MLSDRFDIVSHQRPYKSEHVGSGVNENLVKVVGIFFGNG